MLERWFKLKENNTNIQTEMLAGLTTFMTMAYILIANPQILSVAGMDPGGVFTATALAVIMGTVLMAFMANYPFVLAPGMGLNAFFAYVVAVQFSWQIALLAVFLEGVLFIILCAFNVRDAVFDAIPQGLKYALTVSIGLFIAFIGMQASGIIVTNPATMVELGNLNDLRVILALVGLLLTGVLVARRVKGALFFGIVLTYLLGVVCQITGVYQVDPGAGMYSLFPQGIVQLPPSIREVSLSAALTSADFSNFPFWDFALVVLAFLFINVFDTVGTLIGLSEKSGFLDNNGKIPRGKQAVMVNAISTAGGALLGTSTTTTYIESAAGITEGGRTGLTALTTAGLFVIALLFAPVFSIIPAFATAPALIIIGVFMAESVVKVNFDDFTEAMPVIITILFLLLTFSVSYGLAFGMISYVALKILSGRGDETNTVMVIMAVIFLLGLIFR